MMKNQFVSLIAISIIFLVVRTVSATTLSEQLDRLWDVSWTRFYDDKTNLFYDYLISYEPGKGLEHLPTVEEIRQQHPNPYGYGTGMEDCMISAGVMLDLIVDRYSVTREEKLRAAAHAVFLGIKRCATVHGVPGFLARGVSPADGKSIYVNSSRDQYTHAVHGLWRYYHSPLCADVTKKNIEKILSAIADRMTRNVVPENDYDSLRADGSRDERGISRMWNVMGHEAARLPMIYAAAWDVTKNPVYEEAYKKYLDPAIEQSFSIEDRCPTYALLQMQDSMELLRALEKRPETIEKIDRIMAMLSKRCAVRAEKAAKTATSLDLARLGTDWRTGEGISTKGEYRKVWYVVRECGEAAQVQLMDEKTTFPPEQVELLSKAIERINPARVSTSGIFYLQGAYWKARKRGVMSEGLVPTR